MHHFPVELTVETLSFFVVYMSHHINPTQLNPIYQVLSNN